MNELQRETATETGLDPGPSRLDMEMLLSRNLNSGRKPFGTQIFGRYARVEKALVNAIAESYLQGVSIR